MTPRPTGQAVPEGGRTLQRGDLSKRLILDTALQVVDKDGLEAVTIRRIAEEFNLTPMSLYRHIRTKEEILDGLGELAREILAAPVDRSLSWDDQLRRVFVHMHAALLEHPGIVQVLLTQPASSGPVYRTVEQLLASMCSAGFEPEDAMREIATLESYTLGFTVQQRSHAELNPDAERARLAELSPAEFPHLANAAALLASWASEERFTDGLDRALDRVRRDLRLARRHRDVRSGDAQV